MNKTSAVLVKKTALTDTVYELIFQTEAIVEFTPGQYLMMQINEKQKRMYSILKREGNFLVLVVDTKPGGIASQLFTTIEPGFTTQLLYPFGDLILTASSKPKLFIATGTGVIPTIAMLNELKARKNGVKAQLLWGIHSEKDNYISRYINTEHSAAITITTCVTQPSHEYTGYVGRVTSAIKELSFVPSLSEYEIYLCGNAVMVKETETILKEMGTANISIERY